MQRLSQEDQVEILRRAQEIEVQARRIPEAHLDVDGFVAAAEETGLSRDAVLQALKERVEAATFDVGEMVFAKSADGRWYPARVRTQDSTSSVVRFLNGSEATVPSRELRPFAATPGAKVEANVKTWGGWYGAEIVRVNPEGLTATVSLWGTEETVPLENVRLRRDRPSSAELSQRVQIAIAAVASAAAGGAVGALITWLVMR